MPKYIFFTGGVVSSLGKGLAAASLGALLQARGFRVKIRKLDGYLNVDPGTMSPYQHGEVFVTEDGAETDLDLGHYERFTGVDHLGSDSSSMGRIYAEILKKERRGDYLGGTVQVVPHVTDEIKNFITRNTDDCDFLIGEIGGTVGDIESLPFIEAIRQLAIELGRENVLFIHLTLLPFIAGSGELKTKATQHSVRMLLSLGIQPDMLLCRADRDIPTDMKAKIGLFCNVRSDRVITAKDVKSIYEVPLVYHNEGFDEQVCHYFKMEERKPDLSKWLQVIDNLHNPKSTVNVAIVGKYVELKDAYKSLNEAIVHGGLDKAIKVNLNFVDAEELNQNTIHEKLNEIDAILVPGGFGHRGIEGKIEAIRFARENKIPFLGICLGMQLSVIEAARNLLGISDATSSEFDKVGTSVVGLMEEWMTDAGMQLRSANQNLGGTMRLGAYISVLQPESLAYHIYRSAKIIERHRHRYEVNTQFKDQLEQVGLYFSGMTEDGLLPEILERRDHPFFIAVQFHPEFKSRPLAPHPLFRHFVEAAYENKYQRKAA